MNDILKTGILLFLSVFFMYIGSISYTSFITETSIFYRQPIMLIMAFTFMGIGFKYLLNKIFFHHIFQGEQLEFIKNEFFN